MARPGTETTTRTLIAENKGNGWGYTVARVQTATNRSYLGSVTPNWYSRKKGTYPFNDYHMQFTRSQENFVRYFQQYLYGVNPWTSLYDNYLSVFGTPAPNHSTSIAHSPQALARARQDLIEKTLDQKINLAQAVAEGQKTIDLVASSATKIANAFIALKKGKISAAHRALTGSKKSAPLGSSLADNWLALQYGVKPLLNDVYGAAEHLAQNPKPPTFIVTGNGHANDSHQEYDYPGAGNSGRIIVKELDYDSRAKVQVRYQVANHAVKSMSQLGIVNPATLAWELLPWSFVVDWFLPVGDYLAGLNYDAGLEFVTGCEIQFTKNSWTHTLTGNDFISQPYRYTIGRTELGTSSNIRHDRTRIYGSPGPVTPSFKNPLSTDHMLNALALLRKSIR